LRSAGLLDEVFITETDIVVDESRHRNVLKIFQFAGRRRAHRGKAHRRRQPLALPSLAIQPPLIGVNRRRELATTEGTPSLHKPATILALARPNGS
jgi:hypothetical protein